MTEVAGVTEMRLRFADRLPATIAALAATELAEALGGPTLFDLRKAGRPPLFLSVLLHGNEPSGWDALRQLRGELERASALIFVGNVEAARTERRALPGQPDFNRIWEGSDAPEAAIAEQVVAFAKAAMPRLAIDIHNNTGRNPPYAVLARTDRPTLATARAFASRALLATQPKGVQTSRFAEFCTSVTIEVGMPNEPASTARTRAFLQRLLADERTPNDDPRDLRLFETVARVTAGDGLAVVPSMQCFNFRTAPAGAALAAGGKLSAWASDDSRVDDDYLSVGGGATVLAKPMAIGMYTADVAAARSDCLCYLLEPRAIDV